MECRINPSFDRVVVKEDDPEEMSEGGIYIPTDAQEKPKTGRVIACGPDACAFYEGDHVIFTKYTGTELEVDRVKYLIIPQEELIGTLTPKPSAE